MQRVCIQTTRWGFPRITPGDASTSCGITALGKPPGTWNLITAMADDAIDYMTRIHQTDPSKPIFIKYAPGATHAPHHPTKEWADKISAMHLFDDGYEKLRVGVNG